MGLKLVLMRHGKPASLGDVKADLRPLSEEGQRTTTKMISLLMTESSLKPSHIFSSPLVRAQQTAGIISNFSDIEYQIEEALGNNFDGNTILSEITAKKYNDVVFMIGHAPYLMLFAEKLVGQSLPMEGISKSGAILIEFDKHISYGQGTFIKYYDPNELL